MISLLNQCLLGSEDECRHAFVLVSEVVNLHALRNPQAPQEIVSHLLQHFQQWQLSSGSRVSIVVRLWKRLWKCNVGGVISKSFKQHPDLWTKMSQWFHGYEIPRAQKCKDFNAFFIIVYQWNTPLYYITPSSPLETCRRFLWQLLEQSCASFAFFPPSLSLQFHWVAGAPSQHFTPGEVIDNGLAYYLLSVLVPRHEFFPFRQCMLKHQHVHWRWNFNNNN